MTKNIEAIVLNLTKFKENSVIVHTLSEEYGRKSFIVKIGKNAPASLFQPLNILELKVTENTKSDLWYAGNACCSIPVVGIRNNLHKNTITMFISEVLYRTVKDGAMEEGLYDWCRKQILTLDAIEEDFSNFHIRFLLEFAVALGFSPEYTDIEPYLRENKETVRQFVTCDFSTSMLIPLSGETRNGIAESLLRYLEHHTDSAIKVRSLSVLRELYK